MRGVQNPKRLITGQNTLGDQAMRLILVRIPADTNKQDIKRFFEPLLKRRFFFKKKSIENIEILKLHDSSTNSSEYHALVTIEPDSFAKRAILKLNRKPINGKHIAVREYHNRYWHNDLRQQNNTLNPNMPNRRIMDRRRKNLRVLESDDIRITGHKNFHRTF